MVDLRPLIHYFWRRQERSCGCQFQRCKEVSAMSAAPNPSGFRYYARRWLNEPGFDGGAVVLAQVTGTTTRYGSLTISDCFRAVTLELSTGDADCRRNSLAKLDVLLDVIGGLRAHIEAAVETETEPQHDSAGTAAPKAAS
jgi:hypothetical protein